LACIRSSWHLTDYVHKGFSSKSLSWINGIFQREEKRNSCKRWDAMSLSSEMGDRRQKGGEAAVQRQKVGPQRNSERKITWRWGDSKWDCKRWNDRQRNAGSQEDWKKMAGRGTARRRTVVRGMSRGKEWQKEKFQQKIRGWGHAWESKTQDRRWDTWRMKNDWRRNCWGPNCWWRNETQGCQQLKRP